MATVLLKCVALSVAGTFVESKYGPKLEADGPAGLSSLYGWTPLILIGTGFWTFAHGMKVGAARKKYQELAKKDGETDVEERYALPNLYAQGTSKHARAFNCVQRSHQHIFETLNQVILTGLIGAVNFPISTAVSTLVYAIGRYSLSNAYADAEGDPSKRYSHPLARYMWFGFLGNTLIAVLSCVKMISKNQLPY